MKAVRKHSKPAPGENRANPTPLSLSKPHAPVFRLLPNAVSDDTVRALEQLLRGARRGEIIGLAFAAMYRGKEFLVNATGEAKQSPVFTRGMIAMLDDSLGKQVEVLA